RVMNDPAPNPWSSGAPGIFTMTAPPNLQRQPAGGAPQAAQSTEDEEQWSDTEVFSFLETIVPWLAATGALGKSAPASPAAVPPASTDTPSDSPSASPPAIAKDPSTFPGTEFDILKAFLTSPLGKPFLDLIKKSGKQGWERTSTAEKWIVLLGHLVPTVPMALYGIISAWDQVKKTELWLQDPALLRPPIEQGLKGGLSFDADFEPRFAITPVVDVDITKKGAGLDEKVTSELGKFVDTYHLLPVTDEKNLLFGPL